MSISLITKKIAKWSLYLVVTLIILLPTGDALGLNVAEEAAAPYRYDIVRWHFANFLSKWVHRSVSALPWNHESQEVRRQQVAEYFGLGEDLTRLTSALESAAAQADTRSRVEEIERELRRIEDRRMKLRNDVEETIEGSISGVIVDEGLSTLGPFIFPPVDIRLTRPPRLLVTSPRDRIDRIHDVLLDPDVETSEREVVEEKLFREEDLSAVVLNIGGVATYPASLPNSQPLQWTLQTATHEWLHHFLFLRPLGQNMFNNGDMQMLNETLADLAGKEIGNRVYEELGDTAPDVRLPIRTGTDYINGLGEPPNPDEDFDFNHEMRVTRLRVDELLAAGNVTEAESYMEERRIAFVENGFPIRKLNQAFFAFYGTYADGPASVSPIGDQLARFRELMPDVGTFVKRVAGFSSYEDFLNRLGEMELMAANP